MRMMWLLATLAACGVDAELDTAEAVQEVSAPPDVIDLATAAELTVANDAPSGGIFDPSLVYPADAPWGVMAYSAVPDQGTIRTHLALSSDHGATWAFLAELNTPKYAVLPSGDPFECPTGACAGNLISETPSVIYDADDPNPMRRWKVFSHRYLVSADGLHYTIGTLTIQAAALPWWPWTQIGAIGWRSRTAYSEANITTNASNILGMSDCLALTEPGALWLPGTIELAVGCIYLQGTTPRIRVELLHSSDHAATWNRRSTLLQPGDAATLAPGASINGADLFVAGGRAYVAASASTATGYDGCAVFPIDDVLYGRIRRDASGAPVAVRTIIPAAPAFAGACTFADGGGGYLLPAAFLDTLSHRFRIFRTGIATP
jgi:hypothetical protein